MKNETAPRFRTTVYLTSAVLLMLQSAMLAQAPNSWTNTGSLAIGRHSHTATLLLDGKVLVAGGENDFVQSRSELYDPATGVWELTGGLNVARAAHTATLLQDGKVLVVGGRTTTSSCEVVTSSAEIYDPQNRNWTSVSNLSSPSYGHTATLLPDGRVLVAGGWYANSVLKKTEIYDANTGQWSLAAPLDTARTWHSATLLKTGQVLVAGGALHLDFPNTKVSTLSSAEIFDPSTRQWSSTGSLGEGRYRHTETLLPNGQVLVATGQGNEQSFLNSTEQYDPASGLWISSNGFRRPCAETATLLDNGGVLFVGCLGGLGDGFITETQVFHPGSGIWSEAGRLNIGRSLHTSTLLRDGRVLLAGGLNAFRSAELYVPQPAGSLPTQNFFVPSILSSAGASGSIYTSEMTLTNSSAENATVEFTYTTDSRGKKNCSDASAGRATADRFRFCFLSSQPGSYDAGIQQRRDSACSVFGFAPFG